MLTLHIEAETYPLLLQEALRKLGVSVSPAAPASQIGLVHKPDAPGATSTEPAVKPDTSQAAETPAAAPAQPTEGAKVEQPPASFVHETMQAPAGAHPLSAEGKRSRGRPRKDASAAGVATSSSVGSPATQAAVVENTASVQPAHVSSLAEGASAAGPEVVVQTQTPSPAADLTADVVKESLRAMSQRFKDWNAGANQAMAIIKVYGLERMKDLGTLGQDSLRAIKTAAEALKGDA